MDRNRKRGLMPLWVDILAIVAVAVILLFAGFVGGIIFTERHIDSALPAALARLGLRVNSDE